MAYEFDGLNINWGGGGGFARGDWRFVRTVIEELDVKTVLEYGCGLSTELMVAMGLDVLSLETQKQFADIYGVAGFNVKLCDYDEGYPPHITYTRDFDLCFVDGPGEQERHDRSKSVLHAMEHCQAIYLHDYNLGQFKHLDLSNDWLSVTAYTERQNHLYVRIPSPSTPLSSLPGGVWQLGNVLSGRGVKLSDKFAELALKRAAR